MSGDPLDPCNGLAFREAHAGPFYGPDGKQLAAGERPHGQAANAGLFQGPMPSPTKEMKLDLPKRPCSCCGRAFQPTARRRRLCEYCYRTADESPYSLE